MFVQRKKKSGSLILAPSQSPIKAKEKSSTAKTPVQATTTKPVVAKLDTPVKEAADDKAIIEKAPQATTPPPSKTPKSNLGLGLSLKAILEEDDSKTVQNANRESSNNTVEENIGEKEVSQEAIAKAWKNFADKHKEDGNQTLYMALSMDEPKLEATTVSCFVKNTIQLNTFNEHKQDLTSYLRKTLDNKHLILKATLNTKDNGKMLYTDGEKLGALIKSNANIKFLVDKFGLETEF